MKFEPILAVSDRHGIYQPKVFIENYGSMIKNKQKREYYKDELNNPDYEFYYETWLELMDNEEFYIAGHKYVLMYGFGSPDIFFVEVNSIDEFVSDWQ